MTLRGFTSLSPCENEKDKNLESIERSLTLHKTLWKKTFTCSISLEKKPMII
jgi:hypothetical protein